MRAECTQLAARSMSVIAESAMNSLPGRRANSGGCKGSWSSLPRMELEARFTYALEMLRRIGSQRIAWDVDDVRQTIKRVTAPAKYSLRAR